MIVFYRYFTDAGNGLFVHAQGRTFGGVLMFCIKCGKELPDNANFCEYCGSSQTFLTDQAAHVHNVEQASVWNGALPVSVNKDTENKISSAESENSQTYPYDGSRLTVDRPEPYVYSQYPPYSGNRENVPGWNAYDGNPNMHYSIMSSPYPGSYNGNNVFAPNQRTTNLYSRQPYGQPQNQNHIPFSIEVRNTDVILSLIGIFIWFVSCFLPYASATVLGTMVSASLIQGGDGWFFIGLSIAVIASLYFRKDIFFSISAGLGVALSLLEFFNDFSSLDEEYEEYYAYLFHKGPGCYLLLVGSILVVAGIIMRYSRRKREQMTTWFS